MSLPTPDFVALVKDALDHLYTPVYLRTHQLGDLLSRQAPPGPQREHALRQLLTDTIDALKPEPNAPSSESQRRLHQILHLRYIDGLHYREIMGMLPMSQPQYHRDQRHAIKVLATALWDRMAETSDEFSSQPVLSEEFSTATDFEAATHFTDQPLDLGMVVRESVEMLRQIASQKGVSVRHSLAGDQLVIRGNRTTARQLVISLLSYVLECAGGGEMMLLGGESESTVTLQVRYEGPVLRDALGTLDEHERVGIANQLAQSLGGEVKIDLAPASVEITIAFPACRLSLLVIDDNPGMVQLITRFVADQGYTVLSAGNVPQGVDLARRTRPQLILLDIMLPEQDGWDALQALKHDPSTQNVPVIVCSVLGESQLALALGAAEYIRKPLTRPRLLEILRRWTRRPLRREAGNLQRPVRLPGFD